MVPPTCLSVFIILKPRLRTGVLTYQLLSGSFTWTVVAAGGNSVALFVADAEGRVASNPESPIPVVNGTDTSCVRCPTRYGYAVCP